MAQIGCKRKFVTDVLRKGTPQLTDKDLQELSRCGYVYENYQKMDLSEQNGFESLYFMNITMSEQDLKTAAAKMFADEKCGDIFRIKGFLKENADEWWNLMAHAAK